MSLTRDLDLDLGLPTVRRPYVLEPGTQPCQGARPAVDRASASSRCQAEQCGGSQHVLSTCASGTTCHVTGPQCGPVKGQPTLALRWRASASPCNE
jgi:hypothetical protein